jgi:hypothetical protein
MCRTLGSLRIDHWSGILEVPEGCGRRTSHPASSGDKSVLVEQTEDDAPPAKLPRCGITGWWRCLRCERGLLTKRPVRPVSVVVGHVLDWGALEMSATEDHHPTEARTTHRADRPFGHGVGSRCPHRGVGDADAAGLEGLAEARGEPDGSVTNEEPDGTGPILQCHGRTSRLSNYPGPDRVSGDPGHLDPGGVELDEDQHVEPLQQHGVDREEVAGQHGGRPGAQEPGPVGTCPHR